MNTEQHIFNKADIGPCPFGCIPQARPVRDNKRTLPRAGLFVQLSRHIEKRHPGKVAKV